LEEIVSKTLYHLSQLHKRLDDEIRTELRRRAPDSIRLLRLKKLRLAVKDRLWRLLYRMEKARA